MTDQPGGGWANPSWGEPAAADSPPLGQYGPPGQYGPSGPSGWSAPVPSVQPGVVPLRPLGVGELLDGAITTIRRNPKITIGLAALIVVVEQLVSVAAQLSTGSISSALRPFSSAGPGIRGFAALTSPTAAAVVGLNFVLGTVLGAILTGVLMVVVADAVLGRQALPVEVWQRVKPRFWALLGGSVLAGLAPVAGLLLAGVVGLAVGLSAGAGIGAIIGTLLGLLMLLLGAYLWGVLALTTPAIVLERLGPVQGLRRSWQLAAPDFWRVWGIRALATVIGQVLTAVVVVPFVAAGLLALALGGGLTAGGRQVTLLVLTALGGVLAGAIVQPFLAGVTGLLYVDRRIRGEGLDITLAQSARTAAPPH